MQVLDHGYLRFVEAWGTGDDGKMSDDFEVGIIEAARMSTGKGFLGWELHCNKCGYSDAESIIGSGCPFCDGKVAVGDENLLAHLYNNKHATPFEMAGLIIEVKAPIFIFREWHRHRTQCVAGNSVIQCVSPRGTVFNKTIEDIYHLKYGVDSKKGYAIFKNGSGRNGIQATRLSRKERSGGASKTCQQRLVRTFDETGDLVNTNTMIDVYRSGIKEVYRVACEKGYFVDASIDHKFLTKDGWKTVRQLDRYDYIAYTGKVSTHESPYPPSLRTGIGVWTSMLRSRLIQNVDECYLCGKHFKFDNLVLDHVIPVVQDLKMALDINNLKPACEQCHRIKTNEEQRYRTCTTALGRRWSRLVDVPKAVGEVMTYDLAVDGPSHNYSCNKLIVHNSYNEMSARYIPLPDENYLPTIERCMTGANTATTNKQAQNNGTVLTADNAHKWLAQLGYLYEQAQQVYEQGIALGIPKELARLPVPVARYSRMRASANLRNWLAFLTLRQAPQAQWEIREFANAVGNLIAERFPRTWELFSK